MGGGFSAARREILAQRQGQLQLILVRETFVRPVLNAIENFALWLPDDADGPVLLPRPLPPA
jgi:hypothetical protein